MRQQTKVYAKWIAIFPLIWLCGCVSQKALRRDYANYSEVYGESNNRQLLLNLARELHEEPVYFIQLGSISSQYQFNTSIGITPSYVFRHSPASMEGSINGGFTQTPIFQFLPLTGTNFTQAVLTPISEKVFLTFYDQGWPANWVARTMLESIQREIVQPDRTNVEIFVNDPHDPTYPKFLAYCDDLRNAQLYQTLTVEKVGNGTNAVYSSTTAKLADVLSAIQSGLSVECDTNSGRIVVTKPQPSPQLVAKKFSINDYLSYIDYHPYKNKSETKIAFARATNFANAYKEEKVTFKTRTFEAILYCVANEGRLFHDFEDASNRYYANITFEKNPYGTIATVTRPDGTSLKVRPIIMIQYGDKERSQLSKLVDVNYHNDTYMVGDLEGEKIHQDPMYDSCPNAYQNRTVFSMLSYLFLQTAISTQNLPVQQLIRVQ